MQKKNQEIYCTTLRIPKDIALKTKIKAFEESKSFSETVYEILKKYFENDNENDDKELNLSKYVQEDYKFPKKHCDTILLRIGCSLIKGDIPYKTTEKYLLTFAVNCFNPPLELEEAKTKVRSILQKIKSSPRETWMPKVKALISCMSGTVTTQQVYYHLGVKTRKDKKAVVVCLIRLAKKGVLKRIGNENGRYKIINTALL